MSDVVRWFSGFFNFSSLRMPGVDLNSIIDISIVAYLIYKVLTFVARTRAWTLLKGISLLAIIYFLSDIFRLHTISWLVSNAFSVGIIALIVIFQPEVRKALEQIGKGRKLGMVLAPAAEDSEEDKQMAVDELILACKKMSAVRTGALIVIENEVPLGDVEATGLKLDAKITNQLLISIFEDKMPLHDGAVVISGNRIASAGCILPLTEKEIGAEHGTRHRAAVGISEVSDAHVIIVSNESGYISVATGGKLYKNLSEDEIRNMLHGMKRPPKRKLASFFRPR